MARKICHWKFDQSFQSNMPHKWPWKANPMYRGDQDSIVRNPIIFPKNWEARRDWIASQSSSKFGKQKGKLGIGDWQFQSPYGRAHK